MIVVRHPHVTALPNDASKDVSADAWNEDHTVSGVREVLAADTTVNVPGQYATIQAALDYAATIDFGGKTLTIQLADGTHSGQFFVPVTVGQVAAAHLLIRGNPSAPSDVVVTAAVSFDGILVAQPASRCRILGVRFLGTSNTHGIYAKSGSLVEYGSCDFGANLFYQVFVEGGQADFIADYSISAGCFAHFGGEGGGKINKSGFRTITLIGTPAFGSAFAACQTLSYFRLDNLSFSGSATGARYALDGTAVIDTKGSGATYLPGDTDGFGDTYI